MFDIGFLEMMLVGIVGLLVLGPERLPTAIRTGSLWLGKLRRSFNSIKAEISRELNAEEIKRELHNDTVMQSLKNAEQDLRGIASSTYDISDVVNPDSPGESKESGEESSATTKS